MTRTCSQPASRMRDDGAGAVGRRVADAGEQAVLHEQAGAPGRAARGGARRERLPHAQALVQLRRVGLLIQRVPVGAGGASSRSDASGSTPGETMTGSARLAPPRRRRARAAPREPGSSWIARVLPHGQVEQHHPGGREVAADRDDLVRGLAVARALVVVGAVEAERALVAAVGREVDEAVEEDGVAGVAARAARGRRRTPAAPRRRRAAAPRGPPSPGTAPSRMSAQRPATGRRAAHGVTGTRGRPRRDGALTTAWAAAAGRPTGTTATSARRRAPRRAAPRWPAPRARAPSSSRSRSPGRAPRCRAAGRPRRCSGCRAAGAAGRARRAAGRAARSSSSASDVVGRPKTAITTRAPRRRTSRRRGRP